MRCVTTLRDASLVCTQDRWDLCVACQIADLYRRVALDSVFTGQRGWLEESSLREASAKLLRSVVFSARAVRAGTLRLLASSHTEQTSE